MVNISELQQARIYIEKALKIKVLPKTLSQINTW